MPLQDSRHASLQEIRLGQKQMAHTMNGKTIKRSAGGQRESTSQQPESAIVRLARQGHLSAAGQNALQSWLQTGR